MNSGPFVTAKNLCFNFPVAIPKMPNQNSIGGKITEQNGKHVLQVLRNINFEMSSGMRLALIGNNGAGKSTLLKLISGIFLPSTGTISVTGSIGNAINPTALYRMEATMKSNIYFAAKVHRVESSKISNFSSRVIKISRLEGFEELPLYTFSKGMIARLTFAIQFAVDYDVRVFDEWISMGDQSMRSTLEKYIKKITSDNSIFFIASHSETITKSLCTHGLVLDRGNQIFFGNIDDAICYYKQGDKGVC